MRVVEDEPRLAENVACTVRESAGYAVDLAPDGQEGLFLAEANVYDALILDLMLPKLDDGLGLAIAKALVEAYRGRISAESSPRQGTRVTVEFAGKMKTRAFNRKVRQGFAKNAKESRSEWLIQFALISSSSD